MGCTCAMRASASRYTCITLVLLFSALCCAEAFPKALVIKVRPIRDLFPCMSRLMNARTVADHFDGCRSRCTLQLIQQGGTVVNADRSFAADVLLENGLIAAVGLDLQVTYFSLVLAMMMIQSRPAG